MFKLKTGAWVDGLNAETKTGKVDDPCVGTSNLKDEMLPTQTWTSVKWKLGGCILQTLNLEVDAPCCYYLKRITGLWERDGDIVNMTK